MRRGCLEECALSRQLLVTENELEKTTMNNKRKVEVFSAGCPACESTVRLVKEIACSSCDVQVLDMNKPEVAALANQYGVKTVPAVVIDGRLANCCCGTGPIEVDLRAAGVGVVSR